MLGQSSSLKIWVLGSFLIVFFVLGVSRFVCSDEDEELERDENLEPENVSDPELVELISSNGGRIVQLAEDLDKKLIGEFRMSLIVGILDHFKQFQLRWLFNQYI